MKRGQGRKKPQQDETRPNVVAIIAVMVLAVICLAVIVFLTNHGSMLDGKLPASYAERLDRPAESEFTEAPDAEEPEQYEPGEPYGSPTGEETVDWESTSHLSTGETFTYVNDKTLTYTCRGDEVISIGIAENAGGEGLYLNLHSSSAMEGNEIGYYVTARAGILEYSRGYAGTVNSGTNIGHTDFAILDRLYTSVREVRYESPTDYGLRWRYTGIYDEAQPTSVGIRAVNLVTGSLLGIFDVNISYDAENHSFALDSVSSSDVRTANELSLEKRSETIDKALNFAVESLGLALEDMDWTSLGLDADFDWKASMKNDAVVDKVTQPYFNLFLDTSGKTANFFQDYSACSHIFAVTMPVSLYGYITVYLAPWYELHHMTQEYTGEGNMQRLEIMGYDPLLPRSSQTIVVPQDGNWEKYTDENYPSF